MIRWMGLLICLSGLFACGDNDPPVAPEPPSTVLRPSGELKPWDLSALVTIDQARSIPQGTPLYMRTEFVHGELADLEMTFVQVVDDFLPPMPILMVEASDPVLIQLGGVARGMSGSPLFSEEGTLGAVAYGFSRQDSPPYYGFATPIEWVIGERSTGPLSKPAATWGDYRITPLELVRFSTGQARWPGALPAVLTQDRQVSFEAGRPLAVALMLGELTHGGIGTISYVDGDRVYGFGHPMFQFGQVELPIIEARILGEVSNSWAPYKFASLNPTIRGTLTQDRLPAVQGTLGEGPDLVTVQSRLTLPSGSVELEHQIPVTGVDQPFLVTRAAFGPLESRVDDELDYSLRVSADVSFAEREGKLSRSRLYCQPADRLYTLTAIASYTLSEDLQEIVTHEGYVLPIEEAEVSIEVIPDSRWARVTGVSADTLLTPGTSLTVRVSLRVGRSGEKEVELDLLLPDDLVPAVYQLEAGPIEEEVEVFTLEELVFRNEPDVYETFEEILARMNEEDQAVILQARLISNWDTVVASSQVKMDLVVGGTASLAARVPR